MGTPWLAHPGSQDIGITVGSEDDQSHLSSALEAEETEGGKERLPWRGGRDPQEVKATSEESESPPPTLDRPLARDRPLSLPCLWSSLEPWEPGVLAWP